MLFATEQRDKSKIKFMFVTVVNRLLFSVVNRWRALGRNGTGNQKNNNMPVVRIAGITSKKFLIVN